MKLSGLCFKSKNRCALYCLSILSICSIVCIATEAFSLHVSQIATALDKALLDKRINNAVVGIKIKSLHTQEVIYQRNVNTLFNPASNLKLITAATALFYLKPEYTFKTTLYRDGSLTEDGVLKGNLYIKGGGNPCLEYEELWGIAQKIKNMGIKTIEGDLIGDESFFDTKRICDEWENGSGTKWYNPRISALSLGDNTISIHVKPADAIDEPLEAWITPSTEFVKILNQTRTRSTKGRSIIVDRIFVNGHNYVSLKGSMSQSYDPVIYIRNVEDPSLYLLTVFKELLESCNVMIKGKLSSDKVPESSEKIAVHTSPPLATVIQSMNKISSNFIAEQIVKVLGAEFYGPPGSTSHGIEVIKYYLTHHVKADPQSFIIVDGSGLSPHNRISPALVINLLEYVYRDFKYKYEFVSSLPIGGIDGTLSDRLIDSEARRRVRAKSGRLRHTSSLSGYAITEDNEELAFSILVNNAKITLEKVNDWQDTLMNIIISPTRKE
ncbi:MAG: D-alanyl-D-alanine carboxypeptidase/D-alanyl-D-alanine-endopeptidase [bacterium]